MIYTEFTLRAMRVAYDAHHGQTDKGGAPYIFHSIHIAERMTDELACAVALLHDVAEDTAVSLEALAQQFPPKVMGPLRLLTRMPGQSYMDYIKALCADPIARRVKIADISHNLQHETD